MKKDVFKFIVIALFMLVTFTGQILPQSTPLELAQERVKKWQIRVDEFNKEIVAESSSVSDSERALYLAHLAKIWWSTDQVEARIHLKRSAEKMLSGLGSDDPAALAKNARLAQRTIEIITKIDEKFALELTTKVEKALGDDEGSNPKDNPALAELYVSLGRQVLGQNPAQALACGFDSLRYGLAVTLPALISELNTVDSEKAEMLYRQAMAKVQGSYSESALLFENNLFRYMFDIHGQYGFPVPLRRGFLANFSDRVATAALVEPERPTRCAIAFYARSVPPFIDEYFPAQSFTFRQNLQICTPYLARSIREMTSGAASAEQPKTVSDLVRVAKDTRDPELKVRYWRTALELLQKAKEFGEIISLLDSTDGDDFKSASPVGWDNWRTSAAFEAVMFSFETKDLAAMYRILDRTPKRLRPSVRMRIAKKLPASARTSPFFLENLDEMQKELGSLEQDAKDVAGFYMSLMDLYLKVRPTESELMFRNAAKQINKADSDNPDFLNDKDWAPWQDYVEMNSEVLEIDEPSISSSLNNVSSRRSRVRLKLGLLESSLKSLKDEIKKLDELKKAKRLIKK